MVNILVNDEKYGEAHELAIVNLERLKDINKTNKTDYNKQLLIRSYCILGFCYSKIGNCTTNYEDKTKSIQLALSCFIEAHEVYMIYFIPYRKIILTLYLFIIYPGSIMN